jgi:hypothetical protein
MESEVDIKILVEFSLAKDIFRKIETLFEDIRHINNDRRH